MVVRELLARLGFSVDKSGAMSAERVIKGLANAAKGLVAIFATGWAAKSLFNLVQEMAAIGDETAKTALKLGVTTRALQELRHVAALAGASNESLTAGLRILARNAFEASTGGKEAGKDFAKLGVKVKDAQGKLKPAELLLEEMADGLMNVKSQTERTALAQKLLGRGGTELIPMLMQGSDAIREQRKELQELGAVMDDKLIAMSEEYSDTQDRLKAAWRGIKFVIAKELIPIFDAIGKRTLAWIKANREFLRINIIYYIERAVRWFRAWAVILGAVVEGTKKFIDQIGPMGRSILLIAAAVAILAIAWYSPIFALGLFIVLLGAVIDDIMGFLNGQNSLIGEILDGIKSLWEAFKAADFDPDNQPILTFLQNIARNIDYADNAWDILVEGFAQDIERMGIARAILGIFTTAFIYWKNEFKKFFKWMVQQWAEHMIKMVMDSINGMIKLIPKLPSLILGGAQLEAQVFKELFISSPDAANAVRAYSTGNNTQSNVTIQQDTKVNVSTPAEAQVVGDAVAKKVDEANDRALRTAMQAFGADRGLNLGTP